MPRPTFKQRLVALLELRLAELDRRQREGEAPASVGELVNRYRDDLERLRAIGTGPTPSWARSLADELGLDDSPKRAASSPS